MEITIEEKTNETNINYRPLLNKLGISNYLLRHTNLDLALLYQRLSVAMSDNFVNVVLQCTQDWQIQLLASFFIDLCLLVYHKP